MVEVEHGDWIPYHFFIGLAIAFISFLCCSVVMWLGNLSRIFPTYRKLEKEAQREWRARIVAFWHSIFAVFFITHALWHFPYQDDKGEQLQRTGDFPCGGDAHELVYCRCPLWRHMGVARSRSHFMWLFPLGLCCHDSLLGLQRLLWCRGFLAWGRLLLCVHCYHGMYQVETIQIECNMLTG